MSKRKSRTPARNHAHGCRRRQRRVRLSIGELTDRENAGMAMAHDAPADAPRMSDDERRMALARLFANIKETWRVCPAPLCRRRHRCSWNDPTRLMDCFGPPLTPEQLAEARADFYKMLDWRAGLSS